jgi:hypothetical protein
VEATGSAVIEGIEATSTWNTGSWPRSRGVVPSASRDRAPSSTRTGTSLLQRSGQTRHEFPNDCDLGGRYSPERSFHCGFDRTAGCDIEITALGRQQEKYPPTVSGIMASTDERVAFQAFEDSCQGARMDMQHLRQHTGRNPWRPTEDADDKSLRSRDSE